MCPHADIIVRGHIPACVCPDTTSMCVHILPCYTTMCGWLNKNVCRWLYVEDSEVQEIARALLESQELAEEMEMMDTAFKIGKERP